MNETSTIELNAENICTNLIAITHKSKKNCFYSYVDSYKDMLANNLLSLNEDEIKLIQKILFWYIDLEDTKPRSKPLLKPIAFLQKDIYLPDFLNSVFSDDEISTLQDISNQLAPNHYALLARISDLIWCIYNKNRKLNINQIKIAKMAVKNYIIQSKQLDSHESAKIILRVAYICVYLNNAFKEEDFFNELKSILIEKIEDITISAGLRYHLLITLSWIDSSKIDYILNYTNKILLDETTNPDLTIKYYDLSLMITKDKDKQVLIKISKIKYLIKISDRYADKGQYPLAFEQLISATQEINRLNIEKSIKNNLSIEINKRKQEYNKLPDNMTFQRFSIQIPNMPLTLRDKLFTDIEHYISIIFRQFESLNLIDYLNMPGGLIQTVYVVHSDEDGNLTFDKKPHHIRYSDDEINHILSLHKSDICLFGEMIKNNSYNQFNLQWDSMFFMFKDKLIRNNKSFISANTLELTFDAIKYLFQGKIEIAIHLIIPQLESHFRFILDKNSILTSNMTNENNMEQITLNQMFSNESISEYILSTYGHDIYCNLYFLLLDKRFGNYRNKVCHGLSSIEELKSGQAHYVCWLCIYIIFKDFLPFQKY
ncbi:TPA: DUF4209 domain-containing protein [Legionella pneumophila]|uniref:DUF4209 domain-containing protein n=1 Tax=Legionella pneumophila TaxID=446 RepID=UPI001A2FDD99|nr:DUF4209 domain-containing protein [Legionella pneumophila]HAT8715244.1 DUF4209 domain-containing protein [Legionella jordanis]HCC3234140.1 DUF4209 domain-containing protein [Legionella pneumophila subsp. pneumophila]MCZ4746922.1 DUF4209 domain-containing protein [Legionella pneumophila]HAT1807472.1 DUF4209 domain-containing protein [Legionella pneumophila]HAT1869183.1 DUF4209 domain-containing protein [Legionella pneumophila]